MLWGSCFQSLVVAGTKKRWNETRRIECNDLYLPIRKFRVAADIIHIPILTRALLPAGQGVGVGVGVARRRGNEPGVGVGIRIGQNASTPTPGRFIGICGVICLCRRELACTFGNNLCRYIVFKLCRYAFWSKHKRVSTGAVAMTWIGRFRGGGQTRPYPKNAWKWHKIDKLLVVALNKTTFADKSLVYITC